MNTIAEDVFSRGFHQSITNYELEKERRPYHKYCRCALHKSKDAKASACFHHNNIKVVKKPWYKCSLSIEAPQFLVLLKNKEENNVFTIGRIDQWIIM
ncbi:hypothetical protein CDL12_06986 [Handroanthus impetiginosus]|uniref:Uncharacterized protein n=1 Tax=Handroanthus impetiginosus TaxID=429701 RepID=A0A2G9GAX5_9LAMI|nr:hypothetical protein CDL12_25144 [Handroanthus impetiginosus]PIN20305.1 hypothetical protein CDL12_06985 [Handroanthus impetiginosus]PIN20306.1 hypothetical protein CDL12_06986 [Handroanthus impetiginosus]